MDAQASSLKTCLSLLFKGPVQLGFMQDLVVREAVHYRILKCNQTHCLRKGVRGFSNIQKLNFRNSGQGENPRATPQLYQTLFKQKNKKIMFCLKLGECVIKSTNFAQMLCLCTNGWQDPSRCAMISGRTEGEVKEKEGSGDSGQVSVGSTGILAEPIRTKQSSSHVTCRMDSASSAWPHW